MRLHQIGRLIQINHVLAKHRLDDMIRHVHLFRPLRYLAYCSPARWRSSAQAPRGQRLREALQELGPIFVKFGQVLSTRRDLLPPDIADELALLQDRVPPFDPALAMQLIHQAYADDDLDSLFAEIEPTPMASASIAQVHAATLTTGQAVILKLVRPGIEKAIRKDIDLLYTLAGLAEQYWSEGKRLRPLEVVAEIEKSLFDELDMLREAASASQLKRNFQGSSLLYVPEVFWSLTRDNLLVQERVYGVPISQIETLKAHHVDLKLLSAMGVEIFFTQVFRHSFFHADMHPGNIMVDIANPEQPRYLGVDFGIMGTLSPTDQRYLAENFLAFFNHDYRKVAELHIESGWVPAYTRIDEFESAIRSVCEPIFARPLKEISFAQLLLRLFQTARRFDMVVQPQLVLLQKTLLNIEGLGRQLYPDLDLWETAKPVLETWMQEKLGWQGALKTLKAEAPAWAETLPTLPRRLHEVVKQAQTGGLKMQLHNADLHRIQQEVRQAGLRIATALSGTAFVVGAAIIKGLDGYGTTMVAGTPLLSWVLGGAGVYLLILSLQALKKAP